jgi:hypothetical protein
MTSVYQQGQKAWREGIHTSRCPYGQSMLIHQAWWKAGWHDADMGYL